MFKDIFKRVNGYLDFPVKNKQVKYGLPFFVFMAFALVLLREVGTVRYEFRKTKQLDREDMKKMGFKLPERPETLEEAYEKYKEIDIDNWENIRGPRLWDETPN